jgi:hypothetical protein
MGHGSMDAAAVAAAAVAAAAQQSYSGYHAAASPPLSTGMVDMYRRTASMEAAGMTGNAAGGNSGPYGGQYSPAGQAMMAAAGQGLQVRRTSTTWMPIRCSMRLTCILRDV